jgi:hypothetical protein
MEVRTIFFIFIQRCSHAAADGGCHTDSVGQYVRICIFLFCIEEREVESGELEEERKENVSKNVLEKMN